MGKGPENKNSKMKTWYVWECVQLSAHAWLCVCVFFLQLCVYVCMCAVHIPQSSGAQSMTRSVRLYGFESSMKLTLCVRGERLRCILRGGVSRVKVADWGMTLFSLYG